MSSPARAGEPRDSGRVPELDAGGAGSPLAKDGSAQEPGLLHEALIRELARAQAPANQAPRPLDPKSFSRPTVVVFWASWCPYCKDFSVRVARLATELNGKFGYAGVSVDESREAAIEAMRGPYAILGAGRWIGADVARARGAVLPVIMIFAPKGRLDTVYEGAQSDKADYFAKRLRHLLSRKDDAA